MSTTPYIGRQINHFEMVDIARIEAQFSIDMVYRYRLRLPFFEDSTRTKSAAIILKNPSSADALKADKTIQTAAKTIYGAFSDINELEILNIFAIRGTLPSDVMDAHNKGTDIIGPENDAAFNDVIAKSDYIIIAWGGAAPVKKSLYDQRISEVFEIIDQQGTKNKIYRKSEKGNSQYPFHACYWPINDGFVRV